MNNINNSERDFPFYNNNPHLSQSQWFMLLFYVIFSVICYTVLSISEFLGSIAFCSIMLIPLLYYNNWDYRVIFQKPSSKEVLLAFLMFVGYLFYAIIMSNFLDVFGVISTGEELASSISWETIISLIFSMMGEELLKFIPMMFLMRIFYKISERRNTSFALSAIIIMFLFGLMHYNFDGIIITPLLLQGVGTIFEIYGYYKTKNLIVPYLSHLFTDAFLMILIISGI